jgi:hypothetical protein
MEKTKRPVLLAGLVLMVVTLGYMAFSSLLSVFAVNLLIEAMVSAGLIEAAQAGIIITIATILIIMLLVLIVLALIFSAMGIARCKLIPQEFAGRKGIIIAGVVLSIIIAVFMLFGLFTAFDILSLLTIAGLITGIVLTLVGVCQNKKLIESASPKEEN